MYSVEVNQPPSRVTRVTNNDDVYCHSTCTDDSMHNNFLLERYIFIRVHSHFRITVIAHLFKTDGEMMIYQMRPVFRV